MFRALATTAVVLGLFVCPARAVISVSSTVTLTDGVRAQAVITEPIGVTDGGGTQMAVSVKEVHASILIRDDNITNGLAIPKRQLPPAQAYGQGLPFGYMVPPTTDPKGPWFGLVWPYRDQYDYFPNQFDPLGNQVGTFFEDQPGVYGYVDVDAIARGGPTDPVPPPGSSDPNWLTRGITGNGLPQGGQNPGPATYFNFNIIPLLGPFDRTVRLRIFGASAIVVQQNMQTMQYSEILVPIPDAEFEIQLPEPGCMALLSLAVVLCRRRRVKP